MNVYLGDLEETIVLVLAVLEPMSRELKEGAIYDLSHYCPSNEGVRALLRNAIVENLPEWRQPSWVLSTDQTTSPDLGADHQLENLVDVVLSELESKYPGCSELVDQVAADSEDGSHRDRLKGRKHHEAPHETVGATEIRNSNVEVGSPRGRLCGIPRTRVGARAGNGCTHVRCRLIRLARQSGRLVARFALVGLAGLFVFLALRLTIGRQLGATEISDDIAGVAAQARLSQPLPTPVPTSEPPSGAVPLENRLRPFARYIVQPGDNLSGLGERFSITLDSLLGSNPGLREDPDSIEVGQELLIPSQNGIIYRVQPGDTLSDLASRYDLVLEDIVIINQVDDPRLVGAGELILLPGATGYLE